MTMTAVTYLIGFLGFLWLIAAFRMRYYTNYGAIRLQGLGAGSFVFALLAIVEVWNYWPAVGQCYASALVAVNFSIAGWAFIHAAKVQQAGNTQSSKELVDRKIAG